MHIIIKVNFQLNKKHTSILITLQLAVPINADNSKPIPLLIILMLLEKSIENESARKHKLIILTRIIFCSVYQMDSYRNIGYPKSKLL